MGKDLAANALAASAVDIEYSAGRYTVAGVGELGTIGATPAVVNAVVDALDSAGLGAAAEQVQMPITAERVWRALKHRRFDASPYRA